MLGLSNRTFRIVIVSLVLVVSSLGCKEQARNDSPTQVTAWTGRPGRLTQWGHGADYIYGLLAMPDVEDRLLVLWQWQENSLQEVSASVLPLSLDVVPAANGSCGLQTMNCPYALVTLDGMTVLKEWRPAGVVVWKAGGSMNGEFIALLAIPDPVDGGRERGGSGSRIAVINVLDEELKWVAELDGRGFGTVRRVVVSNDGRYVGIAGWKNGTAMVDAKEGRVLWAERPEHEVSTGYAALAPNGELIYTAGSEGCVYGIEVASGTIVSQRWASETGKSVYAHRVSSLAVSNDGKWLAAGTGPEGDVYVWDLEDDGASRVLRHGQGSIEIVAFSPDAQNIVSVGGGVLKVWPSGPR